MIYGQRQPAIAWRRDRTQPAGPLLSSNGSEQSYVGGTIVLVTRAARSDGGRRNEVVVGRVEQRSQLLGVLDDVIADGSRFVIMGGDAGAGKTTVIEAFLNDLNGRMSDRKAQVITGQCVPLGGDGLPYAPVVRAVPRHQIVQGADHRRVRETIPTQRYALPRDDLRLAVAHPAIQVIQERLDDRRLAGTCVAAHDHEPTAVGDDVVEHVEQLGALLSAADDQFASPATVRSGRAGHKHYRATDVRLFTAIAAQQGTGWLGADTPEGAGRFAVEATRLERRRRHHIERSPRAKAASRSLAASAHRSRWRCSAMMLNV